MANWLLNDSISLIQHLLDVVSARAIEVGHVVARVDGVGAVDNGVGAGVEVPVGAHCKKLAIITSL